MGALVQAYQNIFRAQQGPLPITAGKVFEWLSGSSSTITGLNVSPESSLKLSAVYACVRIISEDVGSLPLILYRRGERGKDRAPEHPLYRLLHDAPNPWMTAMQFRETMQGHLLLRGNAYANIDRDASGRIKALWPLRPDRMDTPVVSEAGRLMYTYHMPNGETVVLSQDEVLHLRGLSTDGILGYSLALHRETIGLSQATLEYGARFFGNDSRPGGVLQAKGRMSAEAADRLRTSWESAHRGLTGAHKVAVLEEGVEWKQVGIAPDEAQYLETRNFQVQEIARIFRVPPHKLSELSRSTYSNISEQSEEYFSDTIRSWLVRWEQQLNKDLLLPREQGTYFAEHLIDAIVRASIEKRYAAYMTARQWGFMSINEIRELENMNPIEDGDEYLQPLNMTVVGAPPPPPSPVNGARVVRNIRRTAEGYEVDYEQ